MIIEFEFSLLNGLKTDKNIVIIGFHVLLYFSNMVYINFWKPFKKISDNQA